MVSWEVTARNAKQKTLTDKSFLYLLDSDQWILAFLTQDMKTCWGVQGELVRIRGQSNTGKNLGKGVLENKIC